MKIKDYEKIMRAIVHNVDEGIHVVNHEGISIIYNEAMANIEKTSRSDILGKSFREVFSHIREEDSTLLRALSQRKSTINQQQTYRNKTGKQITTVNSTFPILDENRVVAAIEIAKDITDIKRLSNTILDLQKQNLEPEIAKALKIKKYSFDNLVGHNKGFLETIGIAKKAAKSKASVLIYGETGTGKELLAQSIHADSSRSDKPFLAQNCAALPATLLEGILFGTSKGGFTGAVDRPGLFEQASGGTLLLDEISAMPYELQGKLLRVLQEDYLRRVGGLNDIPIDVRIIATLNEKSDVLIKNGSIRSDLYFRLNVIRINLLPLREREDDIIPLVESFIEKHNEKLNKQIWKISDKAKKKLLNYNYPGNVRELENIIISAIAMAGEEHVITEDDISLSHEEWNYSRINYDYEQMDLEEYLYITEKEILKEALNSNGRNVSKTALQLGIKRQTLQHKLKKYEL